MDSQQCQVCGEVFLNLNFVILHLNAHSRKEIYECLVSLKSSLEIFMKQYFALKDFINGNVMQEKKIKRINMITFFSGTDNSTSS